MHHAYTPSQFDHLQFVGFRISFSFRRRIAVAFRGKCEISYCDGDSLSHRSVKMFLTSNQNFFHHFRMYEIFCGKNRWPAKKLHITTSNRPHITNEIRITKPRRFAPSNRPRISTISKNYSYFHDKSSSHIEVKSISENASHLDIEPPSHNVGN